MQTNKHADKSIYGDNRQICTFHIGKRLYGVDILDVKEINTETAFTPIFHAPPEIKGYVNIRGQIHLILDLRLMLGHESRETDDYSRLILFKQKVGESFGVLVDRIGDVAEVDEQVIEDRRQEEKGVPKSEDRRKTDLGAGVCKLDDALMVILNPKHLLKYVEYPQ